MNLGKGRSFLNFEGFSMYFSLSLDKVVRRIVGNGPIFDDFDFECLFAESETFCPLEEDFLLSFKFEIKKIIKKEIKSLVEFMSFII